jgi:hypothetical protein
LPEQVVMSVEIRFKWVMYTKILLVVVVAGCMLGCKKDEKPANVLSQAQMVNVIIELYIAEERADATGIPYDSIRKIFPRFESRTFDKLGVKDSLFKNSLDYYLANPKKLELIYTAVVDSLSLRAQELSVAPPKGDVTPK